MDASTQESAISIPGLFDVLPYMQSTNSCIDFLLEQHILYEQQECPHCCSRMTRNEMLWRCTKKTCRKKRSVLKNSFFAKARIAPEKIMLIGYLWLCRCSFSTILTMTRHSAPTIVDYLGHYRSLAVASLTESDHVIGGPGIIVEVDESKFGKRKYNRGHHIEGAWAIGGIERTEQGRFFSEVVTKRDSETICDVLSRHISSGTILHTDCWKGYCNIDQKLDVQHFTVNHSVEFVNHDTGVHTNSIEGKWAGLKRRICLRGRVSDRLDGYLLEEVWRKANEGTLWISLLRAMRTVGYTQ